MEQINIKQEIIDLCDDFVEFWGKLKEEIIPIADDNNAELIFKWRTYFIENKYMSAQFSRTKLDAESVEEDLIEKGILTIEIESK